jgi:hypothetical protein
MKRIPVRIAMIAFVLGLCTATQSQAQIKLLATGTLDQSRAGSFADLSGLDYKLENEHQRTRLAVSVLPFATPPAILFLLYPTAVRTPSLMTRISMTLPATSTASIPLPWTFSPTIPEAGCRLL